MLVIKRVANTKRRLLWLRSSAPAPNNTTRLALLAQSGGQAGGREMGGAGEPQRRPADPLHVITNDITSKLNLGF